MSTERRRGGKKDSREEGAESNKEGKSDHEAEAAGRLIRMRQVKKGRSKQFASNKRKEV